MQRIDSITRARVTTYTTALLVAVSSVTFFVLVPFIPASPVLPLLIGLGLAALSFRNPGASLASLYVLVVFSVLWQLIGFGFFQLLKAGVGLAVVFVLAAPLLVFANKRVQLTALPLAVLAVALMLTPFYYVSIPLIAAAATVSGFASVGALAATFVFFLAPLLLLENALYFTTVSGATTPFVFGQLTLLAGNLRPPLPGLNIFLTGLPADFISSSASSVSSFMLQNWIQVVVPLVVVAVVLLVSSSAGSAFHSVLGRFARLHEREGFVQLLSPVTVSVVISGVFVVLVTALSQPGSGGFQTGLANDPGHLQVASMMAASVVLGTAFVGRERLILKLERLELGRSKLGGLVRECRGLLSSVSGEIGEISRKVPSADLTAEKEAVTEDSSYLSDVEKQLPGANFQAVERWTVHVEGDVLPHLRGAPDRMRKRVVGELLTISTASAVVNEHLSEAGVGLLFPAQPPTSYDDPMESVVSSYQSAVEGVRGVTVSLAELYRSNSDAMNSIMGQSDVSVPVSPDALLDSHDYVTAMKLVSDEYWLGFHLRWTEELEAKKKELVDLLGHLEPYLTEGQLSHLRSTVSKISQATPATAAQLANELVELRSFLDGVTSALENGVELARKTAASFDPSVRRAFRFQTVDHLEELEGLRTGVDSVRPTFGEMARFLTGAIPVMAAQSAAWKSDQASFVVVAQYPLARRVIRSMLSQRGRVQAGSLPYERRTAATYLRIYGSEESDVSFDEEKEVLARNA